MAVLSIILQSKPFVNTIKPDPSALYPILLNMYKGSIEVALVLFN